MSPDKYKIINNNKVEEFYWAGEHVVYINNYAVKGDFEKNCDILNNKKLPNFENLYDGSKVDPLKILNK